MDCIITEEPRARLGVRDFVVARHYGQVAAQSRLLVSLCLLPATILHNGQAADLLVMLAACLAGHVPGGFRFGNHTITDQAHGADLGFEACEGWAHAVLLAQEDTAMDGEAPRWSTVPILRPASLVPELVFLAASLNVSRLELVLEHKAA